MSQELFDEVSSAFSHDSTLDHGWTKVDALPGVSLDLTILEALGDLYWKGVETEVAAAIIALADLHELHPDELPVEKPTDQDLKSERLAGLLKLWNPFDMGSWPSRSDAPQPNLDDIKKSIETDVSTFFENEPVLQRRARAILQAYGFMDLDFVREHRQPTFRSWGQRPIVSDKKQPLYVAFRCAECRHCIRSFHYYECRDKECKSSGQTIDMVKLAQLDEKDRMNQLIHDIEIQGVLHMDPPYRLCPSCLPKSSHPREHLVAKREFAKSGNVDQMDFARELDIWEDHLDGRSLLSLGVIALDRLSSGPRSRFMSSSRDIFPAGNTHCAIMFGPLIIENGVTHRPGGALISLRPIPNFTASSSKDLSEFLATPESWKVHGEEEAIHSQLLSVSASRQLYKTEKPPRGRRFMSMKKQVAGGLFTNYCDRFSDDDNTMLFIFIAAAIGFSEMKHDHEATQKQHKAKLRQVAGALTALIKRVYEFEVKKFLFCFTDRLYKQVKLQYNRLTNNCQDFCNAMLLRGDKWDMIYNTIYPAMPPDRDQDDEIHLRYMMSFAGHMLDPMKEPPFVNPLASSTVLYNSFGHNDADLIDHVSSVRFKRNPESFGMGFEGNCEDEYLLKDSEVTCGEYHQSSSQMCTMADHILDGPHDNLCVLSLHVHRPSTLYTVPHDLELEEELLSTKGPTAWIANRLQILHRLLQLNTYLAYTARQFQKQCNGLTLDELPLAWHPLGTRFACAWHSNKRTGSKLEIPTWAEDMKQSESSSTMGVLMMTHTFPMMQSPDLWKSRMTAIKKRLFDETHGKSGLLNKAVSSCECTNCMYMHAVRNCRRVIWYAGSQKHLLPEERKFRKSHPDYVPFEQLQASVSLLGSGNEYVQELQSVLEENVEYYQAI